MVPKKWTLKNYFFVDLADILNDGWFTMPTVDGSIPVTFQISCVFSFLLGLQASVEGSLTLASSALDVANLYPVHLRVSWPISCAAA